MKSLVNLCFISIVSCGITSLSAAESNSSNQNIYTTSSQHQHSKSKFNGCTDYGIKSRAPKFSAPPSQGFRHHSSSLLSKWFTPYHMVHDELVNPGEAVRITGKFDYDWFLHKDLEDEYIHAYIFGTGMTKWKYLGQYKTNRDGKVTVKVPGQTVGDYIIRMVVDGDHSMADGYISVRSPGRQAVLFDIDGTLTLNDAEQIGDYLGLSTATPFYYAKETIQAYRDKGYQLIFLTARPYWQTKGSRVWLRNTMQQADWHLRTNIDGEIFTSFKGHAEYKAAYIKKLQQEGINIVRVYGNASTDIKAYEMANIPKHETYILGRHAGKKDTQTVGDDYTLHYSSTVVNTPKANCKP
ncbi:lipin/Ned1/Smp2 family protein [Spartinivicinus poritis]|uniref:Haloacid dehalogenase n=1 Tax=Spartinivicinus poritis TaxID=2994640 RepID=A0ABT5UBQ1_9GAMM|nr:HAD family acid phosphatase [Spartinivicinus sp. A2-2]MDE1463805.1 haloacid dehalogenase [Spartinivicinus sp. A2-2]